MNEISPVDMSFEAALEELEKIVQKMESGQTPLDQSIQDYERGMALKAVCEKKLKEASLKIEQLTLAPDGSVNGTAPFDPDPS